MRTIAILFSLVILIAGCTTETKDNTARLTGHVYYFDEKGVAQPVANALVRAKDMLAQTNTADDGSYTLAIESKADTFNVTIEASKVGYVPNTETSIAQVGQTITVPDIVLQKTSGGGELNPADTIQVSGPASHITVAMLTADHIYIKGSGLAETALINFKVTDDNGRLVDDDHQVTVRFSILNGPNGGEYVFPESMDSQNGYVYTILNSGTIAGPVQIQAETQVDGKTIRSIPIRMVIHGGLPDAEHFSLVMEKSNIAARVHYGLLDKLTAYVGDRYSNPVVPGTAIYFSTNYCLVEGSATTDSMGAAQVNFISASPLPPNPQDSSFATITAYTYSDTLGQKRISSKTKILLSDRTAPIEVSQDTFSYGIVNQPINFEYHVHDIWGYPLVGETKISVSATDGELYGDINVELRDTQQSGPGTTDFSFTWAPGDSLEAPQVYITISVNPPADGNGYQSKTILGYKR